MSDPIPMHYFQFFASVEPFLTICGAASAVLDPSQYFRSLIPIEFERAPVANAANTMVTRQLGSCFFLLALIASIFVRTLKYQLASHPYQLERCFASYLLCLAIADLTHIGFTLYDLGSTNAFKLGDWNMLIWGNVGITTGLFVVRSLWFLGVGREVVDSTARKAKETVVETAKTSAKQTRRAIKETTPEAQEDDSSEEDEPRKMVTRSSSRSPRKTYRR